MGETIFITELGLKLIQNTQHFLLNKHGWIVGRNLLGYKETFRASVLINDSITFVSQEDLETAYGIATGKIPVIEVSKEELVQLKLTNRFIFDFCMANEMMSEDRYVYE